MRVSAVQRRVIGIIIDWDQPTQHSMAGNSGSPRFSSHPRILLVNLTFALKKPRETATAAEKKAKEGATIYCPLPQTDGRTAAAAHYRYTGARCAGALIYVGSHATSFR